MQSFRTSFLPGREHVSLQTFAGLEGSSFGLQILSIAEAAPLVTETSFSALASGNVHMDLTIYGAVGETTVNGGNYLYLDRSNPVG